MYCNKCRKENPDDAKFCCACGYNMITGKNQNGGEITLKCDECGGTMKVDDWEDEIVCPYCNAKKVLSSSDVVKIKKIEAKLKAKEMDIENQQSQDEHNPVVFKHHIIQELTDNLFMIILFLLLFGFAIFAKLYS